MRAILLLILFFLLGIATSIAIAWSAALFNTGAGRYYTIASNGWVGRLHRGPAAITIGAAGDINELTATLRMRDDLAEIPRWSRFRNPPASVEVHAEEFACGWPLPCLRYVRHTEGEILVPDLDFTNHGALEGENPLRAIGIGRRDVRLLPAGPIWLHLFVDALLLGAAWFILLRIHYPWRFVQAVGRIQRGLCPTCKYDLRHIDSARCPECGRARHHRPAVVTRDLVNASLALLLLLGLTEIVFAITFRAHPLYEAIHRAAYGGDLTTVRAEIEGGADLNRPVPVGSQPYGVTPLWLAAAGGREETVRWLLQAGADIRPRNAAFGTALDVAALRGAVEVARLLIDAGCDVQAPDVLGTTPLHRAAESGSAAVATLLLERGASVNTATRIGSTPLHIAATAGHTGVAETLLAAGARTDVRNEINRTPLACAVRMMHLDTVQMFLQRGVAIDERTLIDAVDGGNADLVGLLARRGADLSDPLRSGETLLFRASRRPGARGVWELLLAHGVDVNARSRGRTVLMIAARWGSDEFVIFLLENGADPMLEDDDGRTALDYARDERRRIIQRVIKEREDASEDPGDAR
jgi:ankyrin repeat protein